MSYTNSKLATYKKLSPNHSGKRTHAIDRITPHCVVGQLSAETVASIFVPTSRQASCNYAIGYDGKVALIVEEKNRSWCSSSSANDQRAVTIEVASDLKHPYAMKDAAYQKLIDLCEDICKRYKKTKLIWIADQSKALSYTPKSNEMQLTVHRWFANKACPGDWLFNRLDDVAAEVTKRLTPATKPATKKVSITKQPKAVTVAEGKTAKVTFTASGSGLTYKWYYKNKGATKFSLTNTFKSNTYSVTMNSTRAGRQIYCVVTDKNGNTAKTNTVTIDMKKPAVKEKKAKDYAESFSNKIAGRYKTIAGLNIRTGAGTSKAILGTLPKGTKVECFGYYTKTKNVNWYYVTATAGGVNYTGFVSSNYLTKA